MKKKPLIAITLGDPSGIGPEITIKALLDKNICEACHPVVIGDASVLERAKSFLHITDCEIHSVKTISEAQFAPNRINVLDLGLLKGKEVPVGQVSALSGDAAFQYVKKAIDLALAKEVDATVTNPLNKEALNLAGHHYAGHTEIYAAFTNTPKYTMMLADEGLRVVHVSTHVSLREACDRVKKDRVLEVIQIADRACREMGISSPKIGVAGLNPHCGEGGLFGYEEIEEIAPAVQEAQNASIRAEGPIPPDTVFSKARGGLYDIVVAMYHDQGHIPLKVLGFVFNDITQKWDAVKGVNITLGLPIIRTSVDHGTAFDQAGKGIANEMSLTNAIEYAVRFAQNHSH